MRRIVVLSALTLGAVGCDPVHESPPVTEPPNSAEYQALATLVPKDLEPVPIEPATLERGRRIRELLKQIQIPPSPPRESGMRPKDDPATFQRACLGQENREKLRQVLDEGAWDWDIREQARHNNDGRTSPLMLPSLLQTLVADAVEAGLAGRKEEAARAFARAVRFTDTAIPLSDWPHLAQYQQMALQFAARRNLLDANGWRQVAEAVPAPEVERREAAARVTRWLDFRLRELATLKVGPHPGHVFPGSLRACGQLDRQETARLLIETARLARENASKPRSRQERRWNKAIAKRAASLPAMPDEHEYSLRGNEAAYRNAYEAYCKKLDAIPNSVGIRWAGYGPSGEVDGSGVRFDRMTTRELVWAFAALQAYRKEHGRLPKSLRELERVPIDHHAERPLGYDPARGLLWAFGPSGKDHRGKENFGPIALTHSPGMPPKNWVWDLDGR